MNVVIMAGGAGTRFWPLSRKAKPKQLLALLSAEPLIVDAVRRLFGFAAPSEIWIATGEHLSAPIIEALRGTLPPEQVIAEPCPRDTAGCIALAAGLLARQDPDGVMAVITADHVIEPREKFHDTLRVAADVAKREDAIVVFGVRPANPTTVYGYIHRRGDGAVVDGLKVYDVESFREKPDCKTAESYVASGEFYWNSGMFVWPLRHIIELFREFLPEHHALVEEVAGSNKEPAAFAESFAALPKISIDYGIMEKAKRIKVIEATFDWDDVGSWLALERHRGRDAQGNTTVGDCISLDTRDSVIYAGEGMVVATVGVEGLVVVATDDAMLVCRKEDTPNIKRVTAALKEKDMGGRL